MKEFFYHNFNISLKIVTMIYPYIKGDISTTDSDIEMKLWDPILH